MDKTLQQLRVDLLTGNEVTINEVDDVKGLQAWLRHHVGISDKIAMGIIHNAKLKTARVNLSKFDRVSMQKIATDNIAALDDYGLLAAMVLQLLRDSE